MEANENIVNTSGLAVAYGERTVLHDINLRIVRGSVTCICGGSGCGKSTLLRSLIGLTPIKSGSVHIMGQDMQALEGDARSVFLSRIGFMYQSAGLLNSLSLLDNLRIPFKAHTQLHDAIIDELVMHRLAQVQLSHALHLLPGELSGGMLKRAGFARAIALEPELVLSDEPSAGLDPVTAADLDALMLRLKDELGISLVVVTHDLDSIKRIADYVVMLDDGYVKYSGSLQGALACSDPMVQKFFAREASSHGSAEGSLWQQWQGKSP
ncbi:MAG: ATP-binding cassette domain-containing protein [Bradymonadales bacterium]